MQNEWILDVLADLKTFAVANELAALAEQLDDTTMIAASELASKEKETRVHINGEPSRIGPDSRRSGENRRA
ncbi:MAG: hypothetical protein ACU0FH_07510 [Heliomarina sp.]|uniref:hypothetical protein n=1 Tax=Heliomarina TaxID=2917553 RepID=UPI001EE24DC6|nr:hypothetical protein [Heliomarina baculiformis]